VKPLIQQVAPALLTVLFVLLVLCASARPFTGTFTLSTADTNGFVTGYNICISTTNNANRQAWLWVNAGVTNFPFDTTNLPLPNPILIFGNAVATNGQVSVYSAPFLFDTNNYPIVGTNAPLIQLAPTPPAAFNVRTN